MLHEIPKMPDEVNSDIALIHTFHQRIGDALTRERPVLGIKALQGGFWGPLILIDAITLTYL